MSRCMRTLPLAMTVPGVAMLTIGQQQQPQQVVLSVLSQHSRMERVAIFGTLLHVTHAYPSVMKLSDCALAPSSNLATLHSKAVL